MKLIDDIIVSRKPISGFAVTGLAWSSYFAVMPVIKAGVEASDGAYGVALLAASIGSLIAMWTAPIAQRLWGTWALPISTFAVIIGLLWAGVAGALVWLAIAMFLMATGSGLLDVLVNARVSEIETRTGRSLMNLNHALYSFAYAGGALLTGAMREAGALPIQIFLTIAVLLAIAGWISAGAEPDAVPDPIPEKGSRLPTALIWLTGGVVMMAFLSESATEGWSALHLERTLGGSAGQGAMGPAILGLTMGFGRLFGHLLAGWVRDTTLMQLACIVSAIGIAIAAAAGSVVVAYLGFAIAGLGISVVAPVAFALLGRSVPASQRLLVISRVSILGYGAFFAGPPLMGLVSQGFSLRMSFFVVAALLILVGASLVPALARRV